MEKINDRILKGVADGKKAFIGPRIVQLDLTGKCNNNCIGCWVHSPFIKNPPRDKNISLPYAKVKALIEDISCLGVTEIYLSGAGESFLYPDIIEIIELIKLKKIKLNVITNFTFIDEDRVKRIVDLGADMLTASMWAATPETYIKTHPGKSKDEFYKVRDTLKKFYEIKTKTGKKLPHIKMYCIISNINYREIQEFVDFAIDTGVNSIEFQVMDIIKPETSFLALSSSHVKEIKRQFYDLNKHEDLYFNELELSNIRAPEEKELREFPGRFINVHPDFSIKEWIADYGLEKKGHHSLTCRTLTCRKKSETFPTVTNPLINEIDKELTFQFSRDHCKRCADFQGSCPVDKNGKIIFNYLEILGFGSFMRRLTSSDIYGQGYEKDVIERLPCYAGWTYSRILSTGEAIPCCKAAFKPLGNIYKDRFLDIWNSESYQEFRHNAKCLPKTDQYFKDIDCYKSCDNVGMNLQIKEAVSLLNKQQRVLKYKLPHKENIAGEHNLPEAKIKIFIAATQFKSGNLNIKEHNFGEDIVIDSGAGFGFAEYEVDFNEGGRYELWSCYATINPRPLEFYFDGKLITEQALGSTTSGWVKEDLLWFKEMVLDINKGKHNFKIYTKNFIPHLCSFAFLKESKYKRPRTRMHLSEDIYQHPSSLKLLKDKFKIMGFMDSSARLIKYIKSGKLIKNYLDILGIFNGSYAFKGPFHVQIDLTYNCNNNCIGCWCNSPLLEEKTIASHKKQQALPLGLIKELLDGLSEIGTKEIYFSGGGEPFIHSHIMEILTYAKKKGFICYVNTNFTLLNKDRIKRLIDLGVDHLTVSTWAATPGTYMATHTSKDKETFKQITDNLIFLNRSKRETPYIKLYNVIFNLNYHELRDMVYYAKETGSESTEFTLIDTIPGKTDRLLLNAEQIKELQDSTQKLAEETDNLGYLDGVLLFRFDSFVRRICSTSDLSKATYDRNIIDRIPCYIGWCFSRIMPNGDINSCLKSHRIPVGNLYKQDFLKIWNNSKQQYFRKKTLVREKKDPFFRLIGNDPDIKEAGCYKSCDDIGRNVSMHNRIMSLTSIERGLLKVAQRIKRKPDFRTDSKISCKDNRTIAGVINGRKAFLGPKQVVIDITNRCNEKCIGCWLYSPLLKEKPCGNILKQEIDFIKVKKLIDDLASLGTRRIRFTGGGEPFMHPKIMELIGYVKEKGLICCLTTNFSLLSKDKVRDLIRLGIDEVAISLWAHDEKTYKETHYQSQPGIFKKIKENLLIFTGEKKDRPFVTLCNVICNLNYLEVEKMFKFALDMRADGVYFTLIDTIKGATDSLLLNDDQKKEVLKQITTIRKIHSGLPQKDSIKLDYFDGFERRLRGEGALTGDYDKERVNQIPCYVGWIFARVLADGTVCPCCRGVKKSMGNINHKDFKEIWFSDDYSEFRTRAKYMPKTDPYFCNIGCLKMCDNMMHNEEMHSRLTAKV